MPFLGGRELRRVRHQWTIGGDQNVRQIGRRDVGPRDLQPVDDVVDLVGEIDAVPARHQLRMLEVRQRVRSWLRAIEARGTTGGRQAAEDGGQEQDRSDTLAAWWQSLCHVTILEN